MVEITLQALLEAGCHFGHKAERWNPKSAEFIYTEKDGIHIIDLAKTKAGLDAAVEFVRKLTSEGKEILFIGTKRQARGVVKQEVELVGAPYFVERWIGGFLTNWESIKKNIDKIIRLDNEKETGAWKKFPKHEQSKLMRYLARLKVFYGGVLKLSALPHALFIVDVKKEIASVREALRVGIPIVAIVDTNTDPNGIDYVIPANDDAVGSIQYLTHVIALAYKEGRNVWEKESKIGQAEAMISSEERPSTGQPAEAPKKKPVAASVSAKVTAKKKTAEIPVTGRAGKRGRPRRNQSDQVELFVKLK